MGIQIYKPTAKMTGMAISFQSSEKDELFLNVIKQATWNEGTKRGSFIENRNKPGFSTVIKFNQIEAGSIIDALERFYAFKAFHKSASFTSQIFFGPADGDSPTTFVLKVLQTDNKDTTRKSSFFIPISFGEARLIKEYLIYYLVKSFNYKSDAAGNNKGAGSAREEYLPSADEAPAPEENPTPPANPVEKQVLQLDW